MLTGIPVGLLAGMSLLDNVALGFLLGSGVGGVLGITVVSARRARHSS